MNSPLLHVIIWILLATAAVVGYGYWYSVIADKSAAVATLQDQIISKSETAGRIASARATLAEIVKDEKTVRSYFVPETAVVPFINDLQARAVANNAALKVLSVSTSAATAKQPALTLSLTLDGSFDAVMRALGAIEYAPYNLSVAKFSLIENGAGGWHSDIELVVGSVSATAATSTPPHEPTTVSILRFSYGYF